jgi:hypothetical protein
MEEQQDVSGHNHALTLHLLPRNILPVCQLATQTFSHRTFKDIMPVSLHIPALSMAGISKETKLAQF